MKAGILASYNDDNAWAAWLAAVVEDPECSAILGTLGLEALLAHTTDGVEPDDVVWTTPDELEKAARSLVELVERSDPRVQPLVQLYEADATL
jgi:hypothetical protein